MTRPPNTRRALRRFAILAAGLPLAACGADRTVTGSTYPPITGSVIRSCWRRARAPSTCSSMPRAASIRVSARMSSLSRSSIGATATGRSWRRCRPGPAPSSARTGRSRPIREALEIGGVPGGYLSVSTYLVADPARRLGDPAVVPAPPGQGRRQMRTVAARSRRQQHGADLRNEPYWNLGCALQSQRGGPGRRSGRSRPRPRREAASTRCGASKDIENLRQGKDPSTQYRQRRDGQDQHAVGN